MATDKKFYQTRTFNLTLGIVVTAACLWWAFQQMLVGEGGVKRPAMEVLAEIADAFRRADYRSLPLMLSALALFYYLKVVRWKLLLAPLGNYRPVRDLFPSTITGFAFNNVLPAHLGEFVRVFVFSKQSGLTRTAVLSSIVLERIFDIIAILAFLLMGLFFVDAKDQSPGLINTAIVFGAVVCAGLACAAVYLIWTKPVVAFAQRVLGIFSFIPSGISDKIVGMLETGADGLGSLRSGKLLAGILTTSFAQWILNGVSIHLSLWAFGLKISPMISAIVLGVTAFGVTVPSSPGYFGVIQACFMLVLGLFVEDRTAVFAASIYYHMLQWIPVTFIGMFFFLRAGFTMSDLQESNDASAETNAAQA